MSTETNSRSNRLRNFIIACAVLVPLLWMLMAGLDDGRRPTEERPGAPAVRTAR